MPSPDATMLGVPGIFGISPGGDDKRGILAEFVRRR
jgi:hypothetical protein